MAPLKIFSLEEFEKEIEEFRSTSFWAYLSQCDQEMIERKILMNIWYPIKNFFKDIKYWFMYRFHPKHKYHLVDTKLLPGYYDADYRMLHVCFSLLVDYVNLEIGGVDKLDFWSTINNWKKAGLCSKKELIRLQKEHKEIKDLYLWWTQTKTNRKELPGQENYFEIAQKYDSEDQKMLHKLINVRMRLWT